jgi:hypothetical protein
VSATASATASPVPTAPPTPRPNPTGGPGSYTSVPLAFRVDLPEGWRRTACESSPEPQHLPAVEGFTSAAVDEEVSSDIGPNNPGVSVRVEDNAAKQTALQWLQSTQLFLGFTPNPRYEKTTFDGKPDAARVVTNDGSLVQAIAVSARGQIYAVLRFGPPATSMLSLQTSLMNSLHVLSDVELSDAKATFASPAPAAARTAEETADGMAKAFAQKDANALAAVAWSCLWQGNENAGGATRPSTVFLANLQKSLAAGLTVTVQPRPIETQANAPTEGQIRGTWKDAGRAQQTARFVLSKIGNTWYWRGVVLGP